MFSDTVSTRHNLTFKQTPKADLSVLSRHRKQTRDWLDSALLGWVGLVLKSVVYR